jgi:hypothetical protein
MEETINKEEVETTTPEPKLSKHILRQSYPPKRKRVSEIRDIPPRKYKKRNASNKKENHYMYGKTHDVLTSRKIAIGNLRAALETNARGFVYTPNDNFLVRLTVGKKRYSLGVYDDPNTAHRVYVMAVQKRIAELEKEIKFLEQYSLEDLRRVGKLPLRPPKDAQELQDDIQHMFTSGVAFHDFV